MTIEELLAATGLTANDLVPIYDAEAAQNVEPTQKITAAQFAAAVKVLASLVNTTEMNTAIQQSTANITGNTASDSNTNNLTFPDGKSKSNFYPICVGFYRNANWVFNCAAYLITLTNSYIVLELNSGFEYFRGLPFMIMYR